MWQLVYTAPEPMLPQGAEVIPFPAPVPKLSAAAAAELARKPVSMTIVIDEGAAQLEDDDEL